MQARLAQLAVLLAEEAPVALAHAPRALQDEGAGARQARLLRGAVARVARRVAGLAQAAVEILIWNG